MIKVQRGHTMSGCGQGNAGMHRSGRLAGPALFIGEDDEMTLAHLVCPRVALQRETMRAHE
jgi:hypothetical protein